MYQQILEWLQNNTETVGSIVCDYNNEAEGYLHAEPEFADDIKEEFQRKVEFALGEEISRQLGFPIDIILEVLEEPNIQEFLFETSICSNDYSR